MLNQPRKLELFYCVLAPYSWLSFEKYLMDKLQYLAEFYQVPLVIPRDLCGVIIDKGSLDAMRFLSCTKMEKPEMLEKVPRDLWMCIWSWAVEKAEFSEEHTNCLLEKCSTKEVKKKLRETTNTACRHGAFGLPTVVFHMHDKSHMFFCSDRMELLAHLLWEQWQGPVSNIMKGKLSAID